MGEQTIMKLLVAVDGSEHARHAIEAAARLAREVPATEVVLLNVRTPVAYYTEVPMVDFQSLDSLAQADQDRLLETAKTQARALGLAQVSVRSAVGQPAQEIVRVAGEAGVDQIVMGTRGMNALAGLLLGSVAQRVVHLAHVPVLLLK